MIRDQFRTDLSIAEAEATATVIPWGARTKDGHWRVWEMFIATFKGVNPYLTELSPPIKLHFL